MAIIAGMVFFGILIATSVTFVSSQKKATFAIFNERIEAIAQTELPDGPSVFYCCCHIESNDYCKTGSALSIRKNCYEGSEVIECRMWHGNCY